MNMLRDESVLPSPANVYIATFFSHYGAMQYYRELLKRHIDAKPMPVPRSVSASCGTCVRYEHDTPLDIEHCELENVYLAANNNYECVLTR